MQSPADAEARRFMGWEIRPRQRVLLVHGQSVRVGSRAFDVLLALALRAGDVVGKQTLLQAGWPGRVVQDNNLSVQISALRKLLGDAAIVNVASIGYTLTSARADAGPPPDTFPAHPPPTPPRPAPHALQLFGRDADLAGLAPLLGTVPLLTIVGTGGVGKTSLARAAVAELGADWPDGVHWIDLAPLRAGTPLLQLVAETLGVVPGDLAQDADDLVLSLSRLQALVTLDNCEHLLDQVAACLQPLLRQAPNLRWLATSQEPLRLPGETVRRLQPLAVPQAGAALDKALSMGALALFCERAHAADQRFRLTSEQVDAAIELCQQLDGLPLAIEMAAAHVATLGLQGVHDQIAQRLRLRAGGRTAPARHHSLLQTYEWSYGLLSASEQRVFRQLQPFLGGFTAQMAQQLCCSVPGNARLAERGLGDSGLGDTGLGDSGLGDSGPLDTWEMLDALTALVDKSLVQRDGATADGTERLRLLESARDYARLRLDGAGETARVQQRHAEVVAAWFDSAEIELQRWRDDEWAAKYLPERRNVCAALAWACDARAPDTLARLVAALAQLDIFAHTQAEAVQYPVPVDVLAAAALPLRARAYLEFGWAHFWDGSRELGTALSLRALEDFEALGDLAGSFNALMRLVRLYRGRPGMKDRAEAMLQRLQQIDSDTVPLRSRLYCDCSAAIQELTIERLWQLHRIARQAGFDAHAAACRANITNLLLLQGRFDEVVHTAQAMLDDGEAHVRTRAMICQNQALALVRLGRHDEARAAARATLRTLPSAAHMVMDLLALAAAQAGRCEDAALMAGRSSAIKRERDRRPEAAEAAVIAETNVLLDSRLGPAARADWMRLGASMSNAHVLALALPA